MNSLYENKHAAEMIERINQLKPHTKPQWGKMQAAQMLAHCSAFQDIPMGNSFPARGLLGRLVGRLAKPVFYNDKPLPLNMSTIPDIEIKDERNFIEEQNKLKDKIIAFQSDGPANCSSHPHPFFGPLTPGQWGQGLYKHLDHHLKQFGV